MDAERIARAADIVRHGGIACIPTETTYGLAADIRTAGVDAVVRVKGRGDDAPIALIAADVAQARSVAAAWPVRAAELAAAHWPGPLTLVVPGRPDLHPALVGRTGAVGVRVSAHLTARALAGAVGGPITATSANRAGAPAALSVAEARASLGDDIDIYLDAGPAAAPAASTVVAVHEDGSVRVLRQGVLAVPGL